MNNLNAVQSWTLYMHKEEEITPGNVKWYKTVSTAVLNKLISVEQYYKLKVKKKITHAWQLVSKL